MENHVKNLKAFLLCSMDDEDFRFGNITVVSCLQDMKPSNVVVIHEERIGRVWVFHVLILRNCVVPKWDRFTRR